MIEQLGSHGSFRVKVYRIDPEEVINPATGQRVRVGGHLKDYSEPIDEEMISKRHGGGRFEIKIMQPNPKGGWAFFRQRTIDIAGDPRIDDIPRNVAPQAPLPTPAQAGESSSMVKEAFGVLKDQLRERDHQQPRGVDPGAQMAMDMLREQLREANAINIRLSSQIADMQREVAALRNKPPETDPFRDKMLNTLLEGDSARVLSIKTQHESELRMVKQGHNDDLKRMEDRHDRQIDTIKHSYEREIAALKATNELQLSAAKGSFEVNCKIFESQLRQLTSENAELKSEVRELRAKKDKSVVEMAKDFQAVKEAIGDITGEEEEKSTFDKVMEAVPGAVEIAKSMIPGKAAEAQQVQASAGNQVPARPKIVQTPDGQKFLQHPNGQLTAVKKKKKQAPPIADGMPTIEQSKVDTVVGYLERAFAGGQDPETLAQSGRTMVPEEIMIAIRDHGVEVFMSKVAKLPSTSPLSSQAGKNWLRKVGAALVGE